METELRYALERNEFELFYQPQVDCHSMKIISAEALLRWNHPQRGVVSPAEFIPILEEYGLIIGVGEWVLNEACRQLIAWQQAGYGDIAVAVNISGHQLQQENFAERTGAILTDNGYDQKLHTLELEITESTLMQSMALSSAQLNKLNEQFGIKVAIDDFGTSYSSLSSLKTLPIDTLKVDRDFIKDATKNHNNEAITSAIIDMAHSLQLRVVAEGVETEEQLQFLVNHQCTDIQGFLFSRALPVTDFEALLKEESQLTSLCCKDDTTQPA
ncbi:MAG: EAL domain-containing protein, partial [Chromatiales bacterium]|nr:EAL domain-containing protein [Chromatiales bacterium]